MEASLKILSKRKDEKLHARLLLIAIQEHIYMVLKGIIEIEINVSKPAKWGKNNKVHLHSLDERAGVSLIFKAMVGDNYFITQPNIDAKPDSNVKTASGLTPLGL